MLTTHVLQKSPLIFIEWKLMAISPKVTLGTSFVLGS